MKFGGFWWEEFGRGFFPYFFFGVVVFVGLVDEGWSGGFFSSFWFSSVGRYEHGSFVWSNVVIFNIGEGSL